MGRITQVQDKFKFTNNLLNKITINHTLPSTAGKPKWACKGSQSDFLLQINFIYTTKKKKRERKEHRKREKTKHAVVSQLPITITNTFFFNAGLSRSVSSGVP